MDIWAICRYDLRLSQLDYLDLHPVEFIALNERRLQDLNIREAGIAALTSIYVNAHTAEGKPASTPSDFMLFAPPKKESASDLVAQFNAHLNSRRVALSKAGHAVK